MRLTARTGATQHVFTDLSTLLAKASPLRSGDALAGIAAVNATERIAAQFCLADLPLRTVLDEPLIPYEHDEVTRLICDSHDTKAFAPLSALTVGGFRDWLLASPPEAVMAAAKGITPEMAAAVSKLMRNQDLIAVARKCSVVTRFRNTIGLAGRMSLRLQPNYPTDDLQGVAASLLEGLLYGCGDAVIGINPAGDSLQQLAPLWRMMDALIARHAIPTQSCVLAHVTRQIEAINARLPLDLVFQSIGGTEALNHSFGVSLSVLREARDAALSLQRGTLGKQVMYFETGQGAALSANAHHGLDQQTCEARAYAVARAFDPLLVNTVVGFIGPEYLYDGKQIIRAGLEDHFCGKLLGLPMGVDVCYTNHAEARPRHGARAKRGGCGRGRVRPLPHPPIGHRVAGAPGRHGYPAHRARGSRLHLRDGGAGCRRRDAQLPEHQLPRRTVCARHAGAKTRAGVRGLVAVDGNRRCRHRSHRARTRRTARPRASTARAVRMSDAQLPSVTRDDWPELRAFTPARLALGRAGSSLPTSEVLAFQLTHAQARDAVSTPLDVPALAAQLEADGWPRQAVQSAAADRHAYLARPDWGRRLHADSRAALIPGTTPIDLVFVISDGLSSTAIQRHVVPLLQVLRPLLQGLRMAPLIIATQARVALADEVGEALQAQLAVSLIGERPGLSSPDSLGAYLTYAPRVGLTDVARHCLSNIRPEGLGYQAAAAQLAALIHGALLQQRSGVALSAEQKKLT